MFRASVQSNPEGEAQTLAYSSKDSASSQTARTTQPSCARRRLKILELRKTKRDALRDCGGGFIPFARLPNAFGPKEVGEPMWRNGRRTGLRQFERAVRNRGVDGVKVGEPFRVFGRNGNAELRPEFFGEV